jgi:hypothetical protein
VSTTGAGGFFRLRMRRSVNIAKALVCRAFFDISHNSIVVKIKMYLSLEVFLIISKIVRGSYYRQNVSSYISAAVRMIITEFRDGSFR